MLRSPRPSPLLRLAALSGDGVPGLRNLVRAGIGSAFGRRPPFDPDADRGDPGLLGPSAVSWRVVAEPAAIVGGIRALLVQLLHPLAMAGVHDHSRYQEDPLGRLSGTSAYVTTSVFGSTREALAAARRVRRIHSTVVGNAPGGRPYRADDPRLLAWVSIAFTSSLLATDRAFAPRPVTGSDADAFVAEQSRIASLLDPRVALAELRQDAAQWAAFRAGELQLPLVAEGLLPRTVEGLEATLASYEPELEVGDQGREALRFLLWPKLSPGLRAGYLPLLAGAVATLEPRQRALLGLPASYLAVWPLAANSRAVVAGLRLATGTSPARTAALRRAQAA